MESVFAAENLDPSVRSSSSWWRVDFSDLRPDEDDEIGPWGSTTLLKLDSDPYTDGLRARFGLRDSDDLLDEEASVGYNDELSVEEGNVGWGETGYVACPLCCELISIDAGEDESRYFRTAPWIVRFEALGKDKWRVLAKAPVVHRRRELKKRTFQ